MRNRVSAFGRLIRTRKVQAAKHKCGTSSVVRQQGSNGMPARASLRQGRREREESNAKFAAASGQIALGSGSLVQIGVDALGQRAIDTAHPRELLHARRGYAGVTAERFQ